MVLASLKGVSLLLFLSLPQEFKIQLCLHFPPICYLKGWSTSKEKSIYQKQAKTEKSPSKKTNKRSFNLEKIVSNKEDKQ